MVKFLKSKNMPEWFIRLSIDLKYISWVIIVWFSLSWLRDQFQLNDSFYEYLSVIITVAFMIELILLPEHKLEHEIMKRKTISVYLSDKVIALKPSEFDQ